MFDLCIDLIAVRKIGTIINWAGDYDPSTPGAISLFWIQWQRIVYQNIRSGQFSATPADYSVLDYSVLYDGNMVWGGGVIPDSWVLIPDWEWQPGELEQVNERIAEMIGEKQ